MLSYVPSRGTCIIIVEVIVLHPTEYWRMSYNC